MTPYGRAVRRTWRPVKAFCLTGLLCGCAVGPDFKPPQAPTVSGYTREPLENPVVAGKEAQRFVSDRDIPGDWWALFRSPALNRLMTRALSANPSLDAAQAALLQAQENTRAQEGAYYPNVQSSFQAQRFKVATGALASPSSKALAFYNLYTGQLSVGYVPDVFGLNRRTVELLEAMAENQRFQLEATYLTLTSNLAAAVVQEALLRAQIDATKRIIGIERQSVDLLNKQFGFGAVARLDVLTQQAALDASEAALPPFEKALALQRDLITALCGSLPSEEPAETFDLASLRLPEELPVSLPSRLIEQRPDIRAAAENWRSANATVGVAVANRLPQFNLNALIGTSPGKIANLFGPGAGFFALTGAVAQPLFDGFALLHRQRAAEAATAQAQAQYRQTLITAFQNVADTLRALQADADALRKAEHAEQTAQASLDIARANLRLGQVNNLVLLTAQQTYFQALLNRVQAQANRLSDTVALFQALGGGWWNRTDIPDTVRPSLL